MDDDFECILRPGESIDDYPKYPDEYDITTPEEFEAFVEEAMGRPGWKFRWGPKGESYFEHKKSGVAALWPGGPFCSKAAPYGVITEPNL
jgi:hypothetical protein